MMNRMTKTKTRNQKGLSLVETMLSATLLAIVVFGTVQYFTINRWDHERDVRTQLAWTNMATRMAVAVDYDYFSIQDSLPEYSVPMMFNGVQGYRSTIVREVDDPFDGVAPADTTLPDYLKVVVTFAWHSPDNVTDSLTCSISEERGWAY